MCIWDKKQTINFALLIMTGFASKYLISATKNKQKKVLPNKQNYDPLLKENKS